MSALTLTADRLDGLLLRLGHRQRALLPPLAAFLVVNVMLAAVAVYAGRGPLHATTWTSFDSPIYLDIAAHGYATWECPAWEVEQGARACGNVGWFPLYPAVIAALAEVGMGPAAAGVLVSETLWLALLVLLWNGLALRAPPGRRLAVLALVAVAPATFYLHTVYPVAMATCLLTVALICLRDERWLGAGLAGFLATASYPATGVLAGVAGLWLLAIEPAPSLAERARRIALVSGLTVAGVVAVLVYAQLAVGQWDGYFGVQARFHHGVHLPFANWLDLVKPRTEGLGHISLFLSFQALLTTALVVAIAVTTWRRRREATPFDWLLVLWALAFWIVPLCQNVVAYYRTDALVIPAIVALARLPLTLIGVLTAAGAVVTAGMMLAFFQGVLV